MLNLLHVEFRLETCPMHPILTFAFCLTTCGQPAEVAPIAAWQLTPAAHKQGTFQPQAGTNAAVRKGEAQFAKEKPQALVFSGKKGGDEFLEVKAVDWLPKEKLSVEVWARIDQPEEWGGLCGYLQDNGSYERGWLLGYDRSSFYFALASQKKQQLTYLKSSQLYQPGCWYHVLGVYDGRRMQLFVDGKLQGESDQQSGAISYPPQAKFAVGAYVDQDEFHGFEGQIEQVALFDQALTAAQVAARFAARRNDFPDLVPTRPQVADWPTYRRDNLRTGHTEQSLAFPLHLQWTYRTRFAPSPAWPAPAKQDIWHKKPVLEPRVTYDRAYHTVSAAGRVYFGSSSDGKVYCLDLTTGRQHWTFSTGGPVRLAPTIDGVRVLFGSDDGYCYCVQADDGKLLWKLHLGPEDRKIAGNEQVCDAWPVRSGVLVEDGIALFCAGLFPEDGVWQAAVDPASGKLLAQGKLNISPQGYLERRQGRLYVPTGRDLAGAFTMLLERKGKEVSAEASRIPQLYPYAWIGAGDVRFGGGANTVAALRAEDGEKIWSAEVQGAAYSLAIAGGRLLVSTDQGVIYCFGPDINNQPISHVPPPVQPVVPTRRETEAAQWVVEHAQADQGYGLILGCPTAFAQELAQRTRLKLVCVERNAQRVEDARAALHKAGLANRVVVHYLPEGGKLPYTDYLFNLVVDDTAAGGEPWSGEVKEVQRVLRPWGGTLVSGLSESQVVRRGALDGAGEWSHMYANPANTVCSDDRLVGSKLRLQWFGPPGPRDMVDRHHRTVPPLVKSGRLFIPGFDKLTAVDAYNGTLLWEHALPGSRRMVSFRDCSWMAAADDILYAAAADQCHLFHATTGKTLATFPVVSPFENIKYPPKLEWGYLAVVDNLLLGSAVKQGSSRREQSYQAAATETFWDHVPVVCSEGLFSLDRKQGIVFWNYRPKKGLILNATITVAEGKVFFVESTNSKTLSLPISRARLRDLLGTGCLVTALDLQTGQVAWQRALDLSKLQHNLYGAAALGKLVLVGSRNSGENRKTDRVMYDIYVLQADSGKDVWKKSQTQVTPIGGDHGEQDHHPLIIGERLVCEPNAYDLKTGEPVTEWGWQPGHRRGCGNLSASSSACYFRNQYAGMFDLTTQQYSPVSRISRPGCWINMIPAGGLLLVPEASSGCTCDFPLQTSFGYLPIKDNVTESVPPTK